MKRRNRMVSGLLLAAMSVSLFAGCSGGNGKDVKDASKDAATTTAPNALPIVKQPIKIKWMAINYQAAVVKSFNEIECFNEIQKRTGINIEWFHPADSSGTNIDMAIASNDLPDVIWWNWGANLKKYVDQGVAIKLNDLIEKHVPSINNNLIKYPTIKQQLMLDDGTIAMFPEYNPFMPGSPERERSATKGLQMRKDWLDSVNLKAPTTIDEWYNVLKAFKTKDPNGNGKADEIPFADEKLANIKFFTTAWGIRDTFFPDLKTRKVVFGPALPEYKEYLTTMNKWYKEGLIDPEAPVVDKKALDAKVLENTVGSYCGMGSYLDTYLRTWKDKNPKFDLIGLANPVGPGGKSYQTADAMLRNVTTYGGIITNTSKYPVEIAKLMNYMFSEEGSMLQTWGIEGKSYKVVDGKRVPTDEIMKNPEGKTPKQAILKYAYAQNGFARTNYTTDLFEKYLNTGDMRTGDADPKLAWSKQDMSMLMMQTTPTSEEDARFKEIMSQVTSHVNTMHIKFIIGEEPLNKYDDYIATLKKMGIEEAVKIQQAALDRFNARK